MGLPSSDVWSRSPRLRYESELLGSRSIDRSKPTVGLLSPICLYIDNHQYSHHFGQHLPCLPNSLAEHPIVTSPSSAPVDPHHPPAGRRPPPAAPAASPVAGCARPTPGTSEGICWGPPQHLETIGDHWRPWGWVGTWLENPWKMGGFTLVLPWKNVVNMPISLGKHDSSHWGNRTGPGIAAMPLCFC